MKNSNIGVKKIKFKNNTNMQNCKVKIYIFKWVLFCNQKMVAVYHNHIRSEPLSINQRLGLITLIILHKI